MSCTLVHWGKNCCSVLFSSNVNGKEESLETNAVLKVGQFSLVGPASKETTNYSWTVSFKKKICSSSELFLGTALAMLIAVHGSSSSFVPTQAVMQKYLPFLRDRNGPPLLFPASPNLLWSLPLGADRGYFAITLLVIRKATQIFGCWVDIQLRGVWGEEEEEEKKQSPEAQHLWREKRGEQPRSRAQLSMKVQLQESCVQWIISHAHQAMVLLAGLFERSSVI